VRGCVDGYLRLADFGKAKEIGAGRTYTLCGTPTFLSPEVLQLGGYDCCTDWWACGVMLFEVATDSFPYEAASMVALRTEHKRSRRCWRWHGATRRTTRGTTR
jgi:serine/threonine protein kinase